MNRQGKRLAMRLLLLLTVATGLVACGGGTSGGGGGSRASNLLELSAQPAFGSISVGGGVGSPESLSLTPATLSSPFVPASDFSPASGSAGNFFAIQFSEEVSLASVMNGGITVKGSDNQIRPFFVDAVGAIAAENAFVGDAAPAMLRIYFEDPNTPGVPAPLAPDGYVLRLSRQLLRSAQGRSYCSAEDGAICMNQSDTVFPFTVGGQNTPIAGNDASLGFGPTPALPLPSILQVDDEIRVFFDSAIDFQSVVGFNPATGLNNVTSQDPYCSIPFPMAAGTIMGSNLQVTYTPPAPTVLPPNYGYIIYMPNPFTDPTEIRVRFVDSTLAVGLDDPTGMFSALPTFQNYAIPSVIWKNAQGELANTPYTPPTDISTAQNGLLELPPKLPLPGTTAAGVATINLRFYSGGNPNAVDSSSVIAANADGVRGLTDRARRSMAGDLVINRTLAAGSAIANNPEVPDLNIVANGAKLDGFSTAGNTVNAVPGGIVSGNLYPLANPIDDPEALLDVSDVLFGAFINLANNANNPPRRLNNASAIAQGIDPGTPFPPGGTPENSFAPPPLPSQPLGSRMYVVDSVNSEVRVFNSNTFQPLGIVPGVASPKGLGGLGGVMYVSNFSQDTVQRFGLIAGTPQFHTVFGTTSVGAGPTAVAVQGNGEDILVINSLASTMSIIDLPTFAERVQLPLGQGPTEITVSNRWTGTGTTFAYQAYVTNTLSNTVSIYESDSPLPTVPNGPQGKIIEEKTGFAGPLYGTWTNTLGAFQGVGAQGMYVANSQGNSITYLGMTQFNLGPNPGFPGPPSARVFNTVLEYVGNGLIGGPTDVAIDSTSFTLANTITALVATYPGSGRVASFGAANGVLVGSAAVPGNRIFTFTDQ